MASAVALAGPLPLRAFLIPALSTSPGAARAARWPATTITRYRGAPTCDRPVASTIERHRRRQHVARIVELDLEFYGDAVLDQQDLGADADVAARAVLLLLLEVEADL